MVCRASTTPAAALRRSGSPCQYNTIETVFLKSPHNKYFAFILWEELHSLLGRIRALSSFFKVIDLDEQDGEQQLIMNKI